MRHGGKSLISNLFGVVSLASVDSGKGWPYTTLRDKIKRATESVGVAPPCVERSALKPTALFK